MREICCLKNCNHENVKWLFNFHFEPFRVFQIVKLHDFFFDEDTASLVMEYVPSNLKLIIADIKRPQNDALLYHYFSQLFSGVAYLHYINIMHRVKHGTWVNKNADFKDIKPENILVTLNNKIKIADFGLACLYVPNSKTKTYSHQVVTRWYRAPELLFGSITYDPKVDIWACGCILAEYLNGSPLFMVIYFSAMFYLQKENVGIQRHWPTGKSCLSSWNAKRRNLAGMVITSWCQQDFVWKFFSFIGLVKNWYVYLIFLKFSWKIYESLHENIYLRFISCICDFMIWFPKIFL